MNPAVLLIDMQELFLKDILEEHRKLIVSSQLEVLTYCAETDIPVIVVEYKLIVPEKTIECLLDKVQSVPRNRTAIKITDNAMLSGKPNVRRFLRGFDADYLVLMGIYASGCVFSTALTALDKEYKISTSGDLISDDVNSDYVKMYPDNKFPILSDSLRFYKNDGDFFDSHQDLIAHLEAGR